MHATPGRRLTVGVVAAGLSLLGCADDVVRDEGSSESEGARDANVASTIVDDAAADGAPAESSASDTRSMVDITIVGVPGYADGDLAGIVEQDADGLVVGGFATTIHSGDFTTTQRVLAPAQRGESSEAWPQLTGTSAALPPGDYVLTLWVDTSLGGYTRWYPLNTDARGLAGCVHRFSVAGEPVTEIIVGGDVRSTGYVGTCGPGTIPGEADAWAPEVSMVDPDPRAVNAPFSELGDDSSGMVQELLVWRDEFLAIGRIDHSQPLPAQLPPEIAEQFPPEVRALFPDGLPPTLDEAITIISEAGLMAETEAAVEAVPRAYDAIFGLDPVPPTWRFARSADGTDWVEVDVAVPDEVGVIRDAASSGDRLVVVGHRASSGVPPVASEIAVAWTSDLESWTVADLGPESPPDLPDDATLAVIDASVVANTTGWIATAGATVWLAGADEPSNPSPELGAYLQVGGWGYAPVLAHWFAPWDGPVSVTDPAAAGGPSIIDGIVVATATGFVHVSDAGRYTDDGTIDVVRYTEDGTNWSTRKLVPTGIETEPASSFAQPIPDGFVIAFGQNLVDAPDVYLVDETATSWTKLEVPGLPSFLGPAQITNGNGYVLDRNGWDAEFGQFIVATPDGERWLVDEYHVFDPMADSGDPLDGYQPRVAALLDGSLLVGNAELGADRWWVIDL